MRFNVVDELSRHVWSPATEVCTNYVEINRLSDARDRLGARHFASLVRCLGHRHSLLSSDHCESCWAIDVDTGSGIAFYTFSPVPMLLRKRQAARVFSERLRRTC